MQLHIYNHMQTNNRFCSSYNNCQQYCDHDLCNNLTNILYSIRNDSIRTGVPRISANTNQSGHIYQCTRSRRRGIVRTKIKTMIAIIGLGLCQNYQTTPLLRLYSTSQGNNASAAQEPRSYHVEVPSGQVRRNHSHLRIRTTLHESNSELVTTNDSDSRTIHTHSQTGTQTQPLLATLSDSTFWKGGVVYYNMTRLLSMM